MFKEIRYLNIVRNMVARSEDVKVLGIVRDPLSVLASWVLAPREFDAAWDIRREWRHAPSKNRGLPEECFGFEKWKQFAQTCLDLQERYPRRFRLVDYDALNAGTLEVITSVFAFCGLSLTPEVSRFIDESSSRHDPDPYSVYRSGVTRDRWKSVLPGDVVEQVLAEVEGTPLARFLADDTDAAAAGTTRGT